MTLSEFARNRLQEKHPFIPQDEGGEIIPIMIWQHLIRKDGFKKVIEHKLSLLTEDEFVHMARRPISLPTRPATKVIEADPYLAQDTTLNIIIFDPELDEGWADNAGTEFRIHLFYYEK